MINLTIYGNEKPENVLSYLMLVGYLLVMKKLQLPILATFGEIPIEKRIKVDGIIYKNFEQPYMIMEFSRNYYEVIKDLDRLKVLENPVVKNAEVVGVHLDYDYRDLGEGCISELKLIRLANCYKLKIKLNEEEMRK